MAEQFLFDQRCRYGGTVDGDQRRPVAAAGGVQGPGNQFLAGSEFAFDQDGCVRWGDLADLILEVAHGVARTDDRKRLSLAGLGVGPETVGGQRFVHGGEEFMSTDGRFQVVGGAELHGTNGAADVRVAVDHDQRPGGRPAQFFQSIENTRTGYHTIDRGQILIGRIPGRIVPGDLVTGMLEHPRQGFPMVGVAVDHQQFGHGRMVTNAR